MSNIADGSSAVKRSESRTTIKIINNHRRSIDNNKEPSSLSSNSSLPTSNNNNNNNNNYNNRGNPIVKLSNTCLSIRCIQLNQKYEDLFKKEWNILQKLKHESLCPCIELVPSIEHNVYYICSAQHRTTLNDEILHWRKENKRVNDARVYQVCSQALNAFYVLHMNGIYLGKLFDASNIYLDKTSNIKIGDYAYLHFYNLIEQLRNYETPSSTFDFAILGKILLQYICGPKPLKFLPNGNRGQIPEFSQQQLARIQKLDSSLIDLLLACVKFEITDPNQIYQCYTFFSTVAPVHAACFDFKYVKLPHLKCLEVDKKMVPSDLKQAKYEDISIMKRFISQNRERFCLFAKQYFIIEPHVYSIECINDLPNDELYFPTLHKKQILIPHNLLPVKSDSNKQQEGDLEKNLHYSNLATLRGLTRKQNQDNILDHIRKLFPQNKESSLDYQMERIRLFRPLLLNYPESRMEIIKHARDGIPPTMRGEIWSCLLDCPPLSVMNKEWNRLLQQAKTAEVDINLERQISVDVVRCHQYHHIMKTQAAKDAVTLVLHTWVRINQERYKSKLLKGGVYWQGIDSICAIFVVLNGIFQTNDSREEVNNSSNLARALFSMDRFVHKFLDGYFVHNGHEGKMQRDLTVLSKLINWIDVEIGVHLELLGFGPELYAISWLLTCFSHVLPMEKVYLLWDTIIMSSSEMILFTAVAIIRQLKSELLHCDFNTAMIHFQNLQTIDIREAVKEARMIAEKTPKSFLEMPFVSESSQTHIARKEEKITISEYRAYHTARISAQEFAKSYAKVSVVLDIRPLSQYRKCHLQVGTSIFQFAEEENISSEDNTRPLQSDNSRNNETFNEEIFLLRLKFKIGLPIILIDENDEYTAFCKRIEKLLMMERIPYVCAVFGGFRAIRNHTNLDVVFDSV
jgi:hypothetical protein